NTLAAEIENAAAELLAALSRIVSLTGAEPTPILGTPSWDDAPITEVAGVLGGWQKSLHAYNDWVSARDALDMVREYGLELIANGLYDGSLEPSMARSTTDLLIAEALWRRAQSDDPTIDEIDGAERSECVVNFRALDRKRIEISRAEVLRTYFAQRPAG